MDIHTYMYMVAAKMTSPVIITFEPYFCIIHTFTPGIILIFRMAVFFQRGWTAYLAAAVDPQNRVFAVAPQIMGLQNWMTVC